MNSPYVDIEMPNKFLYSNIMLNAVAFNQHKTTKMDMRAQAVSEHLVRILSHLIPQQLYQTI